MTIKPCKLKMLNIQRAFNSQILALAAMVVNVASGLVFGYSTVLSSYPTLAAYSPLVITNCLSMAMAVSSIALRQNKLTFFQIVCMVICFTLLLFSASCTGNYQLVHSFVLVVAIAGLDLNRIFEVYGFTVLTVIVVIALLATGGFIYNKDVIPNYRMVFSFGLNHPNGLGACLFAGIAPAALALRRSRAWWAPLIISCAAASFSYVFLSSHAAAAVLGLLAAAIVADRIMQRGAISITSWQALGIAAAAIPIVLLISLLVTSVYFDSDNQLLSWLNEKLHGRIRYAHEYYELNGGFTLFGRSYMNAPHYHNGMPFSGVDSGYCWLALVTGIVPMLSLVAIYIIALFRIPHSCKSFLLYAVIIIAAFHLVFECHQLYIQTGILWLIMSAAFNDTA